MANSQSTCQQTGYLWLIACNFTKNDTPQKMLSTDLAISESSDFFTVRNHLQEHVFLSQTKQSLDKKGALSKCLENAGATKLGCSEK